MQTLQKSIERTAEIPALDPEELQLWLEQYPNLTPYIQIQLLRMAARYQLDPLSDEISVMETHEGYQAFITIDGWVKLINGHEQYAGMSLREAPTEESQPPEWMGCTIYRHDRILPIVVKEYLQEVRTEHASWQQMPRRMLRHRVIQQCARLAFGISKSDEAFVSCRHVQQKTYTNAFMTDTSTYLGSNNLKNLLTTKKTKSAAKLMGTLVKQKTTTSTM